jgi:hypothetical protein
MDLVLSTLFQGAESIVLKRIMSRVGETFGSVSGANSISTASFLTGVIV